MAKEKSIRDGEMCKINQESITLLESLSELFHSYCVQAMLLLCSGGRAIKIRGMDTDKWVDRHPFSVLADPSGLAVLLAEARACSMFAFLSLQQLDGLHLKLQVPLNVF